MKIQDLPTKVVKILKEEVGLTTEEIERKSGLHLFRFYLEWFGIIGYADEFYEIAKELQALENLKDELLAWDQASDEDFNKTTDVTFCVRKNYSDSYIASVVELCLGGSNKEPPYMEDSDGDGKWILKNNDFWLRKKEERIFSLSGRYIFPLGCDGEPPRFIALKALAQWLESDLMFG